MPNFKNPQELGKSFDWKQDLGHRIAANPAYKTMANYAVGENHPANEDYFYAFKDAYERSKGFNDHGYMFEDEIGPALSDRYWELQYQDQQASGYDDRNYERYGEPDFVRKYGEEREFTQKGLDAWKKWMNENYGGYHEDYQAFGIPIAKGNVNIQNLDDLNNYYKEWGGDDSEYYQKILNFWKNKLGYGGN